MDMSCCKLDMEVKTVCGDGSETGLMTMKRGEKKSTTGVGASLTPDYRVEENSNN